MKRVLIKLLAIRALIGDRRFAKLQARKLEPPLPCSPCNFRCGQGPPEHWEQGGIDIAEDHHYVAHLEDARGHTETAVQCRFCGGPHRDHECDMGNTPGRAEAEAAAGALAFGAQEAGAPQ